MSDIIRHACHQLLATSFLLFSLLLLHWNACADEIKDPETSEYIDETVEYEDETETPEDTEDTETDNNDTSSHGLYQAHISITKNLEKDPDNPGLLNAKARIEANMLKKGLTLPGSESPSDPEGTIDSDSDLNDIKTSKEDMKEAKKEAKQTSKQAREDAKAEAKQAKEQAKEMKKKAKEQAKEAKKQAKDEAKDKRKVAKEQAKGKNK